MHYLRAQDIQIADHIDKTFTPAPELASHDVYIAVLKL